MRKRRNPSRWIETSQELRHWFVAARPLLLLWIWWALQQHH